MDNYDMARNFAGLFLEKLLGEGASLTNEIIQESVKRACSIEGFGELCPEERAKLVRELESQYQTVIGRESELRGDDKDTEK